MAFRCAHDGLVLAALPARLKVSFGRLAQAVGASRSTLRPADETDLRVIRMEAGGISPVVQATDTRVVFDPRIAELPVVYLGTGRAGETMQVKSADLIEFVRPALVDIVAA
jgi:prolyl-tRNA editing enzyme YbaK/EbsC (Cys-tRNA(Pro) deacylase)